MSNNSDPKMNFYVLSITKCSQEEIKRWKLENCHEIMQIITVCDELDETPLFSFPVGREIQCSVGGRIDFTFIDAGWRDLG